MLKRNRMRLKQTPESRSIYSLSNSRFSLRLHCAADTDACAQLANVKCVLRSPAVYLFFAIVQSSNKGESISRRQTIGRPFKAEFSMDTRLCKSNNVGSINLNLINPVRCFLPFNRRTLAHESSNKKGNRLIVNLGWFVGLFCYWRYGWSRKDFILDTKFCQESHS